MDPVDDVRATNPASNEELFAALTKDFVEHGYDVKRLVRTIMNSAVYQLSSRGQRHQSERQQVLFEVHRQAPAGGGDSGCDVAGDRRAHRISPGYPAGTRALQLPDTQVKSRVSDVVRAARRASSATLRSGRADPSIAQALHVINGDTLNKKLSAPDGDAALCC